MSAFLRVRGGTFVRRLTATGAKARRHSGGLVEGVPLGDASKGELARQLTFGREAPGQRSAFRAASTVRSMSSAEWAADTNMASKGDGGR